MTKSLPFTLIIPAHNEAAVIERCLKTALAEAPDDGSVEVIVAANGCSDDTVSLAKMAAPQATVLDLPTGSKTKAINAANAIASRFPRIYLDADIECSYRSLLAMAVVLTEPDVMTASPKIRLELGHCNRWIKAYYAAWLKQPFAKSGKGGAGCYGLSQTALESIGEFPPIIGDDIWIHTRFPDEQKRLVQSDALGREVFSIVRPPKTLWQQVKVEARRIEGNADVKRDYPSAYVDIAREGGGLGGALKSGTGPFDLAVFLTAKVLVRIEMRRKRLFGKRTEWTRDLSSRGA
ncbi:glycosyltransferase [Erythrobacter aurantius]|uniref:glycosyltransferase n=1 Tax=Erythrobacter aurantius TaxID=2909249 RepID=UPI002079281F|nr:glycosyltransferase [Erythrobacter aurantius]